MGCFWEKRGFQKLKKSEATGEALDETLTSLIEHFEHVTNKDIKQSLLAEISKKISFRSLQRMVKEPVTLYEYRQAKKKLKLKGVFGSKLRKKQFKTKMVVRDRDITHFTTFVLQKHTRDMAWGTKYIKFSNGEKIKVGNSVLEAVKSAIIRDYKKVSSEFNLGCEPEDRIRIFTTRTYLKWMKAVRWTRSAALAGLDSYSATGFDAIETVDRIIDQLDTMAVTKNELKANMQILKRFLKFDFKSSIEDCSSGCGFHCDSFALSQNSSSGCNLDQKPRLKKKDDEKHFSGSKMEFVEECACIDHASICSGCKNQVDIFARIREILLNMNNRWLLHKFEIAIKDINEYKKHIVRAIHQDKAKTVAMEKLSQHEALILFDFAMKFLPQKYREAQSDFFAKKGLSWHVMVCLWKTESGEVNLKTMAYLMGNIKQDWFCALSNIESFIKYMKTKVLVDLKVVHLRADNAGYYHNPALILGLPAVSKATGVLIQTFNTSEPGYGKDICDRKIAVFRSKIREYQMTRQNVTDEHEMKAALVHNGGVRGSVIAIARLDRANEDKFKPKIKIDNVTSMNNFEFTEDGQITVHRQYKIGCGKKYQLEEILDGSTGMKIDGGYFEGEDDNLLMTTRDSKQGMNYPCPVSNCILTFSNEEDMMKHNEEGDHSRGEFHHLNRSVDDRVKIAWIQGLSGKVETRKSGLRGKMTGESLETFDENSVFVPKKGWALFERAVPTRLNFEARSYLVDLFEAGKTNRNHRVSPEEAELKLRDKFPTKEETWLSVKQIKSLFSRLANPERTETNEDELVLAYNNADAEQVISATNKEALKMKKKKKKTN